MPDSLVSILIPCYNAEDWIAETLESILAQTWTQKEIIVVDDSSSDKSLEIAKSFTSPLIKIISQEKRGASAARNRAFQEAQGDYIQYLDADDLLAPDKIELQMQVLLREENTNYIVAGEWARFYSLPTEANFIAEPVWNDLSPLDWLICSWTGGGMMPLHAWLTPRAIAEAAGSWNDSLSLNDDGEYFFRVVLASKGVKFCSGAKSYYRSGISGSLSSKTSRDAFKSAFQSIQLCSNYLLALENSSRVRNACATAFQGFIYAAYPDVPDLVRDAEAKVNSLGGCNLICGGGLLFQLFANTLGWKLAKRIHRIAHHQKNTL
ncbi:putative glycosyl transferase [Tolypothrix tenuis PCC 7101]|uniref:Putative glycosyl transferase n=1 Tax=Tolypothrix tenuis PCC 7101 TaxID=231146 RepID=A0A1Z4N814_9CYAN|nr:glycosyltransferase family 2 protein [Aulosira sp. FACHB-113]BAZ01855.1 putative glycosyl transferase [Tolypothrix tenuis PCC 7101]BAZ74220.1 putative glycosyl transferase [Aulosira laxa NIES-50]